MYGALTPKKVYNKWRSEFVVEGIIVAADKWIHRPNDVKVRIFDVFDRSKRVIQVKMTGSMVQEHEHKIVENHVVTIKGAITEDMPLRPNGARVFTLNMDFRLVVNKHTTITVKNIRPFDLSDVTPNYQLHDTRSIQNLRTSQPNTRDYDRDYVSLVVRSMLRKKHRTSRDGVPITDAYVRMPDGKELLVTFFGQKLRTDVDDLFLSRKTPFMVIDFAIGQYLQNPRHLFSVGSSRIVVAP